MISVSMSREKSQLPTMASVSSAGTVPPISASSAPRSSARFARRGRSILPLKQPPTSGRSPGSPSLSATCQAREQQRPVARCNVARRRLTRHAGRHRHRLVGEQVLMQRDRAGRRVVAGGDEVPFARQQLLAAAQHRRRRGAVRPRRRRSASGRSRCRPLSLHVPAIAWRPSPGSVGQTSAAIEKLRNAPISGCAGTIAHDPARNGCVRAA